MKFIITRWSFVLSFSAPFVMIIYELNAENLSNKTGQRTTLYVGSMAPMTGKRAWWGAGIPLAIEMAFEDINKRDDILRDYELKLISRDTQVLNLFRRLNFPWDLFLTHSVYLYVRQHFRNHRKSASKEVNCYILRKHNKRTMFTLSWEIKYFKSKDDTFSRLKRLGRWLDRIGSPYFIAHFIGLLIQQTMILRF